MKNQEVIQKILMSDDIVQSINDNIDFLLEIIPELNDMIGFDHNHPHHPDKLEKRIKYLKTVFEYIKQIDSNIDKKIKIKI